MCGAEGIWEISLSTSQFCNKCKSTLKNEVLEMNYHKYIFLEHAREVQLH